MATFAFTLKPIASVWIDFIAEWLVHHLHAKAAQGEAS